MKLLPRYILTTVVSTTLLVLFAFLGLDLFINFLNEVGDIGKGNYTVWQALSYATLRLPQSSYQLFPMAGLLGALLGLGSLASHSELIVMRSAGMSLWQIIRAVLLAALVIMIVVTFLGELLAPPALRLATTRKAIAISQGRGANTVSGIWVKDGNNYSYIGTATTNHELFGIYWFQVGFQHRLNLEGFAGKAIFKNGHWYLQNAMVTHFHQNRKVTSRWHKEILWPVKINSDLLSLAKSSPHEMLLTSLKKYIHYRKAHGLAITDFALVFWQRLWQPLATLIMILLAVPFVFGPLRTMTMGFRIVIGISAGLTFYFINQFFGPISVVYQFPAFWAAALPTILFSFFGLFMMLRAR